MVRFDLIESPLSVSGLHVGLKLLACCRYYPVCPPPDDLTKRTQKARRAPRKQPQSANKPNPQQHHCSSSSSKGTLGTFRITRTDRMMDRPHPRFAQREAEDGIWILLHILPFVSENQNTKAKENNIEERLSPCCGNLGFHVLFLAMLFFGH